MGDWNPRARQIRILDSAYAHIESVNYKPSSRWLFYRLLQGGLYKNKRDYSNFLQLISKARKNFWGKWNPDTLIDETRESIINHGLFQDQDDWIETIKLQSCRLDAWYEQPYCIEVLFEARAMLDQFRTILPDFITFTPFAGDASIFLKSSIAKRFEANAREYGKDRIIALYFGDCDKKGKQIPQSAFRDIQAWCGVPIEVTFCGLTLEQAIKYNLPENFEKLGEYQWEALSDEAAREIINTALENFLDYKAIKKVQRREREVTKFYRHKINGIDWGGMDG